MNVNVRDIHKLPQLQIRAAEKLNAVPLLTPNAGYLSSITAGKRLKRGGLMTKVTPSDVLRLSGLFDSCNVLNLHSFVGRIRRSRRIRREQSTLFAQTNMCKLLLLPEIIENGNWRTAFMFGFQIPVLYCSGDLFRYVFPSR